MCKSEDSNSAFTFYLTSKAEMNYTNQLYYRFENIIEVDDVISITVGDIVISIPTVEGEGAKRNFCRSISAS